MEVLLFIALIIIFGIVLSVKNKVDDGFKEIQKRMDSLSDELRRIKITQNQTSIKEEKAILLNEVLKPVIPAPDEPKVTEEKTKLEPFVEESTPIEKVKSESKEEEDEIIITKPQPFEKPFTLPPPEPPKPGFFERNPDLEKFIGENLANKIGIAILVLGVGFFVKYAIDQNWINEIGRVFIGVLCGGVLIGVAHRLRKTFDTFSSVLVGGGIAVLYLTITIAFQEYQIFSQTAAFILMVIITGFTVFLSLGYNKIELAILAILGGFGSPFMVSTGEGNYVVLFTYVLILDIGMLALAYFKKWKPIKIISYALSILLFGSWLATKFDADNASMIRGALIFATLFYFTFFAMTIVNNLKEKIPFKVFEFSLILSNTFLYYSAGMFILHNDLGMSFRGLFTTLLAVFNFGFAFALFKNKSVDRNLVFVLIGLVLTSSVWPPLFNWKEITSHYSGQPKPCYYCG